MKYIIILGDGMADEPLEALNGKTPLEAAQTDEMDRLARVSRLGLAKTIPDGMSPGSDTANLAVLGYNPKTYYTGRSPLEALSIGVALNNTDVALRCNLVTLSEDEDCYEEKTILDHSAGEISTKDGDILLKAVKEALEDEVYKFYTGTSYRHLTIWKEGRTAGLTPPHDILTKTIGDYLPEEVALKSMMEKSYHILNNHPINLARKEMGLNKANSIWFWGAGTRPCLDSFEGKTGKKGVMISAVDLLKGIAAGAGMTNINVEGANGTLHTNYEGKALAAVKALIEDGYDFAYIHVEAPDEMGHQGSLADKIKAIEALDKRVIKVVTDEMDKADEPYRMLIMPDHPTPIALRTHTGSPVPYLLYDSRKKEKGAISYNERNAKAAGNYVEEGYRLIDELFNNNMAVVI